jgi:large subunit ribosomal protein L18
LKMKQKTNYTVRHRRRREGRTNYKKRLELLKGRQDRLVIRKTNKHIIIQLVRYAPDGDQVLLTANSKELEKKGWKHSLKNIPAAYLTGLMVGKKAREKKATTAILDMGLYSPLKGSRVYAALKGAIDSGLKVPAGKEIFPGDGRLKGEHVAKYLEKHKTITQDYEKIKLELLK